MYFLKIKLIKTEILHKHKLFHIKFILQKKYEKIVSVADHFSVAGQLGIACAPVMICNISFTYKHWSLFYV